jgi:hypothetical protein
MNKIKSALPAFLLGAALVVGAGYATAWTGPTATPPGNNVPSPINVSEVLQVKAGPLHVGSVSTLPGAVSFRTYAGKTAIATTSPIADTLQLLIGGPQGRVGAAEYCDQNGANCFDYNDVIDTDTNTGLSCRDPIFDSVGPTQKKYQEIIIQGGRGGWGCTEDIGCVIKQIVYNDTVTGRPVARTRLYDYYQEPASGSNPETWRSSYRASGVYKNGDSRYTNIIADFNGLGLKDDKDLTYYNADANSPVTYYPEKVKTKWTGYDTSNNYSQRLYVCSYTDDL